MDEMKTQALSAGGKTPVEDAIQLVGKTMTLAMIVGPKDSRKSKAQIFDRLWRMTHLHLEARKIEVIGNLEYCTNLTHLYLHDNLVYTLVNEPFKGMNNLT